MATQAKKTILLVEDEVVVAIAESETIKRFGFDVIIASSGEKAVTIATVDKKPDLILMDIDLGNGSDGPKLAKKILEKRNVPIVFLTSHAEKEMVEKVRGIRHYGYVMKSSGEHILQSSIEMALDLFDSHNRRTEALLEPSPQGGAGIFDALRVKNLVFDASIAANSIADHDGVITEVNDAFLRIWHYRSKEEVIGKPIVHFLSNPDDAKAITAALKAQGEWEGDYTAKQGDGSTFIAHGLATVVRNEYGKVIGFQSAVLDVTGPRQAEKALEQSKHFVEKILWSTPNLVYIYDVNEARNVYSNRMLVEYLGYTPEQIQVLGSALFDNILHPEDAERVRLHHARFVDVEETRLLEVEYRMKHADGKWHWLRSRDVLFLRDPSRGMLQILGSAEDVTERKQAVERVESLLAEKELLLKEVHHRIKNNMNTMMSLLSLQKQSMEDPVAVTAMNDARLRMQSMMVLYDKLYRSKSYRELSMKEYLIPLVHEIVGNFPNRGMVTIKEHVEGFTLDAKRLTPLGIIVNELLTNVMKHAFTGRERGVIDVYATLRDGRAAITVQDDGIGLSASFDLGTSAGFGLRLIGMLTEQLGGSIRMERKNGTAFTLGFAV